jgi:hypothetical protein
MALEWIVLASHGGIAHSICERNDTGHKALMPGVVRL